MTRDEILESPTLLRIYDMLGKPLPGEFQARLAEELPEIRAELDALPDKVAAELAGYFEERRRREAERQGAAITRDEETLSEAGAFGDPPLQHRPASARKE